MKNTKSSNKFTYLHVLQGQYGFGWEDLCSSENYSEVRQNLKEYRDNEGGHYRLIERREPNPQSLGVPCGDPIPMDLVGRETKSK